MSSTDLQVLERESGVALKRPAPAGARWPLSLRAGAWLFWTMLAGNGAFIVWMWLHGGGISGVHGRAEAFTSLGRITGLLGVYLALVQVLMLSRLRPLERYLGFDRLTGWHRVNGKVCVSLIVAHAALITVGYALAERISIPGELSRLLRSYPGMVAATVGTVLMVAVLISSLVIVRRRMRYESWHFVHFLIYAGIALGYLHQIPTGNEFAAHPVQADYWISLYAATLAVLLVYRVALPIRDLRRYELTVRRVAAAGPGVTSIEVGGRRLERLHAVAGQFMLWRFLTPGRWWQTHPFSLSAAPDGRTLRLTVKAVGDFTGKLPQVQPGTRVMVEGPFGVLTSAAMRTDKALLIAGGIGITPLRALFEELAPTTDVVLVYRAVSKRELALRAELEEIAERWGATLHLLPGDHRRREGAKLLSPASLRALVPDIAERDVYVCGPPAMMERVAASLAELRVPEDQIHSERFALAA
jgi:predicted ferric reductase